MGMGGAGVATTADSLATYWNPAGMVMSKKFDIRIQGGGQGIDRGDVFDSIEDINFINLNDTSPANVARLQQFVNRINQPGTNLTATASGGFYIKGNFGEHALGFNISDVATGGGFLRSPVGFTNNGSNLTVNGQFSMNGLEARQAVLSYAYAFMDRIFSIGVSGKIIQGAASSGATDIQGASDDIRIFKDIGRAKITTALGLDLGAMFRPASWLRMGIVAKDITAPTFDAPNGDQIQAAASDKNRLSRQSVQFIDVDCRCGHHEEQYAHPRPLQPALEPRCRADHSFGTPVIQARRV